MYQKTAAACVWHVWRERFGVGDLEVEDCSEKRRCGFLLASLLIIFEVRRHEFIQLVCRLFAALRAVYGLPGDWA